MKNLIFAPISSFYRNNLYNELSKNLKFSVIYINNKQDKFRSDDFIIKKSKYNRINYFNLGLVKKVFFLFNILLNSKKKNIFICGWNKIEYWIILLFSLNSKKIFICDSFENKNQIFYYLKSFFLSKMDHVIVPGSLHKKFIKSFNFKKDIFVTKSVGIIKPLKKKKYQSKKNKIKIVYIGRISEEKNLSLLFKLIESSKSLTLSIYGKDEINLKSDLNVDLKNKVKFKGSILNKKIKTKIKEYDLLILPSKFEPWGLVIEEAIYNGIPVICSDKVGSHKDLIKSLKLGYVFENNSLKSLKYCIKKIRNSTKLSKINKNLASLNYNLIKKKHLNIYEKIMR